MRRTAGGDAALRSYLRRLPTGPIQRRPTVVVGAASNRVSPERAVPLVAHDRSSPFPLFCGL